MRIFDFNGPDGNGFNGMVLSSPTRIFEGGGVADPGTYIGFAIGPQSDISECKVDGQTLTLGFLLPWRGNRSTPKFEPVRGVATGNVTSGNPPGLGDNAWQVNRRLQILAYEPGDPLSAPGPRQPKRLYDYRDWVNVLTYQRIIRMPFQGRRQATFCFNQVVASAGGNWSYSIEKVRYVPRETVMGGANNIYAIGANALVPQRAKYITNVVAFPAPALDSDASTTNAQLVTMTSNVGEQLDEIWIWAKFDSAVASSPILASLVAWD